MRIAICDDNENELSQIKDVVEKVINKLNLTYKLDTFHSGINLLNEKVSYDLLFLDIQMEDIDGLTIAKEIRKYNKKCIIIFISNYKTYLQDGYKVKADRYIYKPIDPLELEIDLKEILNEYNIDSKFIHDSRVAEHNIYLRDIKYIEFYDRKTLVHTTFAEYSTTITLKEWMNLLDKCYFSQCHKAYIINLRFVQSINKDIISIKESDKKLPLSRFYKKSFLDNYTMYLREQL